MTDTHRPLTLATDASGGLGAALAREFATRGHDLALVARSTDKLEALAAELSARHGIQARALRAGLADPAAPAALAAELGRWGLSAEVLVNNAGFASYGDFARLDLGHELQMIRVNVAALVSLTHHLLPGMLARGRGRVLNVASTGAFMPGPLMAVHYASKAFVLSFSEALAEELRGRSVTVTALCPGPIATGFQARAQLQDSRLLRRRLPDAARVARQGVQATLRGRRVLVTGLGNQLPALAPRFSPRGVVPGVVRRAQAPANG